METHTITQEQLNGTPQESRKRRYPGVTGPGQYTWNEAQNTYEPVQEASDGRFGRSGLGIGGLRHHRESTAPTATEVERMEEAHRQPRCKRCGGQEWTGATFTTDPSSGLCDDCYS